MKKVISIIFSITLVLTLTACSKSENTSIDIVGEHKDTYTSIHLENSSSIDERDYGDEGTNTYKENEDGSLKIDMSFLVEDENIVVSEPNKTQFEINQEVNSENTSSDTEEINDKFGLINQGITITSVINEISKIAERDGFNTVEIVVKPDNDIGDTLEYIVRFDTYDYYILTYHVGEGCISFHDESGYLASVYGEQVEEREWQYEE